GRAGAAAAAARMVGARGFEPPTLWSQTRCATRLRYAPTAPDDTLPPFFGHWRETSSMTARLIDGKAIALKLREDIKARVDALKAAGRRVPGLAVVIVGNDPASQIYVRNKHQATEAAGMLSVKKELPATATQEEVLAVVQALNADPAIDGILVQLPEPKRSEEHTSELQSR